jgi:hypothetical protein
VAAVSELIDVENAYEAREFAYRDGLRRAAPRDELGLLAAEVAHAAATWNAAAYRRLHSAVGAERDDLGWLTERTEVLSELWEDIRSAYASDI